MTRILVIGLQYPPHHSGGYEVSCRDVVERLVERGHDVAVLTSNLRRPGVIDVADEHAAAAPVWRDLHAWFRDDDLYAPHPARRWRMERANQRALREALARHRPDVVAAWQLGGLSLGLLTTVHERGLPVVHTVFDDWLLYGPRLDAWSRMFQRVPAVVARAARPLLGVPTTVPDLGRTGPWCFISEVTRQRTVSRTSWSTEDTALVYCGIDGRLFGPAPDATPVAARPWGGRLLYVGRYDPRKGIDTAIAALAHLDPSTTLEVQGTGDVGERNRLAALATDLGVADRVDFCSVDRTELVTRYRAADALVFPSEWEEPFGLVPLEAMACGTPVLATGVGGSGEFLVDRTNCLRFTAGDPESLAASVEQLAADADLRGRLVDEGHRTAAAFDVDRLTDALEAWYVGAATGFASGRPASRSFHLEPPDGAP